MRTILKCISRILVILFALLMALTAYTAIWPLESFTGNSSMKADTVAYIEPIPVSMLVEQAFLRIPYVKDAVFFLRSIWGLGLVAVIAAVCIITAVTKAKARKSAMEKRAYLRKRVIGK